VVTGAVVAIIGLNLAAIPVKNMAANNFEAWMQALTFVSVAWWPCSPRACCSAC
jgi:xanthine/uracil permease